MSGGLRYVVADVFTSQPLTGNPLAVVLDADDLDAPTMQRIAREMNLSETVFVLHARAEGAHYRARIFTPGSELPFAGHPTLGTAHVLANLGAIPSAGTVVQQCGAGLIPVTFDAGIASFRSPPASFRACDLDVAAMLRCVDRDVVAASFVDVGVEWLTVLLADAACVRALRPDAAAMHEVVPGVTAFARETGGDAWVRVRSFAPAIGVPEDPVCGSGNACVAAVLHERGQLPADRRYTAVQGEECGRPGRVHVRVDVDGTVHIGGHAVVVADGILRI